MAIRLEGAALDGLTVDPTSPEDGQLWYRSDTGELRGRLNGVNETIAPVSAVFEADEIQASVLLFTSSLGPQDAFLGEPTANLTIPTAGDWLVFFECDVRVTNSNGLMAIAVGLNGINVNGTSERQYEGNSRAGILTIHRLNGVLSGDTVHGVFYKVSGPGDAEVRNRSLAILRIA